MTTNVRKRWLEAMRPSDIRSELQELLDEFVGRDDPITKVLNPATFRRHDHGFPEDDAELAECMSGRMEWFCNVMRIRAVWEYMAAEGKLCITFHDLDQILLWTYRV